MRVFACTVAVRLAQIASKSVTVENLCAGAVNLYDNVKIDKMPPGSTQSRQLTYNVGLMLRNGVTPNATLFEVTWSIGKFFLDLSIVKPNDNACNTIECANGVPGTGFNTPMGVKVTIPAEEEVLSTCSNIACLMDGCDAAYRFPFDDQKVHACTEKTLLTLQFCPHCVDGAQYANKAYVPQECQPLPTQLDQPPIHPQPTIPTPPNSSPTNPQPSVQPQPTISPNDSDPKILASYSYRNEFAGNQLGQYQMVTDIKGCKKETAFIRSPVGPMSQEVSFSLRGPMNVFQIAVYYPSGSDCEWNIVSRYDQKNPEKDRNIAFFANLNISYTVEERSPQCLVSADGRSCVEKATHFGGVLGDAKQASGAFAPGVTTGVEVNFMTNISCSDESNGPCLGYHDSKAYHGFGGGKKLVLVEATMPRGLTVDRPAIWMLNAQIMHANQYGCNCRDMGVKAGCGELDWFEIPEDDASRSVFSTEYYFFDGKRDSGNKNFAKRKPDTVSVFGVIIDDSRSQITVIELSHFNFAESISYKQIQQWLDAGDVGM